MKRFATPLLGERFRARLAEEHRMQVIAAQEAYQLALEWLSGPPLTLGDDIQGVRPWRDYRPHGEGIQFTRDAEIVTAHGVTRIRKGQILTAAGLA